MKGYRSARRSFLKRGLLGGAGAWSLLTGPVGGRSEWAANAELAFDPDPEILFERVEKIVSGGTGGPASYSGRDATG